MTVSPDLDRRFREAAAAEHLLDVGFDVIDSPIGPLLVAATMQLPDLLDSPAYRDRFGGVRSRRFSSVGLVAP